MASGRFVRNEGDKEARARFTLGQAFSCAWCGIRHALATQRNMRIHLAVAVVAVALGLALGLDAPSWAAVILCIAGVLAAECANTAIEAVVDLVTDEYAELARVAKDCAAGAVCLMAAGSVAVGAVVYGARALELLGL
ncbi:MAG: diacylglycerol kinase family protein [Eggerthellaceae bacterium]|nr:diacylglycerol kinase family protein [Eggerthellaceae bacterium]